MHRQEQKFSVECPCNKSLCGTLTVSEHRRIHKTWEQGVKLPPSLWLGEDNQVFFVDGKSPLAAIRLANRVAKALQRENGYDIVSFPSRRSSVVSCGYTAGLVVDHRHAIGLAVAYRECRGAVLHWESMVQSEVVPIDRITLATIWVARNHRKSGLATRLVIELARHYGVTPQDMAYSTPYSDSGCVLVKKFARDGMTWMA